MEDIAEAVSLSVATSLDIGLFSASSAATPSLTIPPPPPSPPPPPLAVEHYTNPIPPPPVAPPPQPSNSGLAEALLPAYMQPDVSPQPSQPVLGPTLGPLGPDLSARPSGVLGAPGPAPRQSTPPSPVRLPSQLGPLGPQPMGARAPPGPPSQEPQSAAAQLFALPALFPDHAQLLAAPALGPDDRLPQEEAASGEASEVSYSAPSASLQRQRSPVEVESWPAQSRACPEQSQSRTEPHLRTTSFWKGQVSTTRCHALSRFWIWHVEAQTINLRYRVMRR